MGDIGKRQYKRHELCEWRICRCCRAQTATVMRSHRDVAVRGGSTGGCGQGQTTTWHSPCPSELFFKSRGYLSSQKGTLKKYYTVSVFISWRLTFATQVFAQYKIPLYSRMMALLVFLPHSGHTWFVSGVKPTYNVGLP